VRALVLMRHAERRAHSGAVKRADTSSHLVWEHVEVDGRPAVYGVAGVGPPLVFVHGWGLSHRTYRRALKHLVAQGIRVYAPALPGFGRTQELPTGQFSFAGYSDWLAKFMDAAGITGKVTLVGHSFGGGVAIKAAYDWPKRVGRLVLVNSIGGTTWRQRGDQVRMMQDRPLWDWGLHLQADTFSLRQLTRVVPVIAADALPNAMRQPRAVWRVGRLIRDADFAPELQELKRRRVPVVILWGRNDTVLPLACLESLRAALGSPTVRTVEGSHGWLLAQPERFAEEITNIMGTAS
jgi:pimeloyl-ACP methyl ester carboxylesterase